MEASNVNNNLDVKCKQHENHELKNNYNMEGISKFIIGNNITSKVFAQNRAKVWKTSLLNMTENITKEKQNYLHVIDMEIDLNTLQIKELTLRARAKRSKKR